MVKQILKVLRCKKPVNNLPQMTNSFHRVLPPNSTHCVSGSSTNRYTMPESIAKKNSASSLGKNRRSFLQTLKQGCKANDCARRFSYRFFCSLCSQHSACIHWCKSKRRFTAFLLRDDIHPFLLGGIGIGQRPFLSRVAIHPGSSTRGL